MFFYFSALLGSTFGMMESFALIMGYFEFFFDSFEKRKNRKVFAVKTQSTRAMLSSFMKIKNDSKRITVEDSIFETSGKKRCLSS